MSAATGSSRLGPEHGAETREGDAGQDASTALARAVEAGSNDPKTSALAVSSWPWRPGDPLPALAVVDGVEVAVLSAADYRDLLAMRARQAVAPLLKVREALSGRAERKGLSTIERDAEVATFLTSRFRGRETLSQLQAACIERFGVERAPSRGRIGVFRQRWNA